MIDMLNLLTFFSVELASPRHVGRDWVHLSVVEGTASSVPQRGEMSSHEEVKQEQGRSQGFEFEFDQRFLVTDVTMREPIHNPSENTCMISCHVKVLVFFNLDIVDH